MNTFDTIDLLTDTIPTPTQTETTTVKFPCTGFCYYVIRDAENILLNYFNNDQVKYYNDIFGHIRMAGDRKKNNDNIADDGEFIDQQTIKDDFPDIVNNMNYIEMSLATDEDYEIVNNNIYMILLNMKIMDHIVVNRSNETFIMFKTTLESFFVIDSHKSIHGQVTLFDAARYITRDGLFRGVIQIGTRK